MSCRFLLCVGLLGLLVGGLRVGAAESAGAIGPGTSKEAVLSAYGLPAGQSRLGSREILNYPQGQVTLEHGRVVSLDFRGAAVRAPGATGAGGVAKAAGSGAGTVGWLSDCELAAQEATRRMAPMLVWFSGADWSPASRHFRDEVALHPDFGATFHARYVLLRVDLADHNGTPRDPNGRLRERLGVTVYPTLIVLSATEEFLARIDLSRPKAGESYVARVIAAVREAHDLLGLPPLPVAMGGGVVAPAASSHRPARAVTLAQVTSTLLSAGWGAISAVGTGLVVAVVLLWLVWRRGARPSFERRPANIAERISDAASGLPTLAEIMSWPKARVVVVAAGLAEAEGFRTERPPADSDCDSDILLKKSGEPELKGLVCCAGSNAGVVTAKRVRELFGVMTAKGVSFGWFVAPLGFSAEARAFAGKHGIRLSDGHRLLAQLHELPPVALPGVTRQSWVRA